MTPIDPEYDPEATLPGMSIAAVKAVESLQQTQSQTKMRLSSIEELLKKKKSNPPKTP